MYVYQLLQKNVIYVTQTYYKKETREAQVNINILQKTREKINCLEVITFGGYLYILMFTKLFANVIWHLTLILIFVVMVLPNVFTSYFLLILVFPLHTYCDSSIYLTVLEHCVLFLVYFLFFSF